MDKINYPLLYFELQPKAILGILVGTGYQVVEKDLKSLKATLSDYLQRNYKKYDDYPIMEILEPRMKVIKTVVRPTYRNDSGSFPLSKALSVPIPIVYGETEEGHYECHLPVFEEVFLYYDARQLDALAQHFATNLLNQLPPEKLYRLMQYQTPRLDVIPLKVNFDREFNWEGFFFQRQYRTLSRLTERYPYSKNVRKATKTFPEVAWEMDNEVANVIDKMINSRANVILVGTPGAGKSAVLQQAIRKITSHSKKQKLNFSFWRIMSQRITASTQYLGEWQEVCEALVEELSSANGILWVVDLAQLLQTGGEGAEDSVAAFLIPYLQDNKLQIVGEATPQELESMRRLLPAFVQSFQLVQIDEMGEDKVQRIMDRLAEYSTKNLKIRLDQEALSLTYRLLLRYYPYESFPGKAVKFLSQVVSQAAINQQAAISKSDIIQHFIQQTGLPELFLRDDLVLDTKELADYFNQRIIGQPAAVEKLCNIVKIYKVGINNPHKPINTLLFVGPTGVGKTAAAKTLADYFFGKGQKKSPLIRIDMSEFQHSSHINRFIGVGREAGQLVKEIRERPFSVLVLDEIEKASPAIFDALLTILDEGILVDNFGRVTNFRNTIVIMTSNLGATRQRSIGYTETTDAETNLLSAVERHFRPEFVNRIDGVVAFQPLSQRDIRLITYKELEAVKKREGLTKLGLTLRFSERLVDYLVSIGFDERYGARPLQRAIEQKIVNPLAGWLLEHPAVTAQEVLLDYDGVLKVTQ